MRAGRGCATWFVASVSWGSIAGALRATRKGSRLAPAEEAGNGTSTILFVAGLEGTGHHFFDAVLGGMNVRDIRLKDNWNAYGMISSGESWSPRDLEKNVQYLKEEVSANPGEVILIRAVESSSYPNGVGTVESRRYHRQPSIPLLLKAVSQASQELRMDINLRILVTQRSPEETLVATCMHRRDLELCPSQAETLALNAHVLAEQLKEVDPTLFQCVRYGDLPDLGRGLAAALVDAGTAAQEADAAVRVAWAGESHHDPQADSAEVTGWAEAMRAPLSEIDSLCKEASKRRVSVDQASPDGARALSAPGIRPDILQIVRGILPFARV